MSTASDRVATEARRLKRSALRLLTALQDAGARGLTNGEMSVIAGLRYGGRLFELREAGHDVRTEHVSRGTWRSWLVVEGEAGPYAPGPRNADAVSNGQRVSRPALPSPHRQTEMFTAGSATR